MRYLFPVILCVLIFASPIQAGPPDEVRELLKVNIDAVMVLLKDPSLDKANRNKKIIDIITPVFDYQTMAKLSLGKKYWPKLSAEKQAAFSNLFIERLQKSYLDKLDLYSNEEILYGDPQEKGKQVHQPTTLIYKDSRIEMLYKFYRSAEEWKIYDVEIGGVSVIQTYRSQFDGVLSDGTIDDLLEKLKVDGTFTVPGPDAKEARAGTE
jgi:phospholipid transport system substrate-binding protein